MRFQLLGGLDCPDWILAGIANLARLTSIKLKLISSSVVTYLLSGDAASIDGAKIEKFSADAGLLQEDSDACVEALCAIIRYAARYELEGQKLAEELMQLGLPKEHTSSLVRIYEKNRSSLIKTLVKCSLQINRISSVYSGAVTQDSSLNCISFNDGELAFVVDQQVLKVLIADMQTATKVLKDYDFQS